MKHNFKELFVNIQSFIQRVYFKLTLANLSGAFYVKVKGSVIEIQLRGHYCFKTKNILFTKQLTRKLKK